MKKINPEINKHIWGTSLDYFDNTLDNGIIHRSLFGVKKICATDNLSIQLHPTNTDVQKEKHEIWYIRRALKGAQIIAGYNKEVARADILSGLKHGSIINLLNCYKAIQGDWYYIAPGTVHAIQAGCTVWEIQNSIENTYRLHDFGRGRELNIMGAMDTMIYSPSSCKITPNLQIENDGETIKKVVSCQMFDIREISYHGRLNLSQLKSNTLLIQVDGESHINQYIVSEDDVFLIDQDSYLSVEGCGTIILVSFNVGSSSGLL